MIFVIISICWCMAFCLHVFPSSVRVLICPHVCLFSALILCLSICIYVYLSQWMSICLYVWRSISFLNVFICLNVCLTVFIYGICLYDCNCVYVCLYEGVIITCMSIRVSAFMFICLHVYLIPIYSSVYM